MGGSIGVFRGEGLRVGILDLTDGEPTPRGSRAVRKQESDAASRVLGIEWRRCLGLPNRTLEHTLDARRSLASVFREVRPRFLFAPFWEDAHTDHVVATQLIEAARFWAKLTKTDMPGDPFWPNHLLYYFSIHLRLHEQASFVVDISNQFETKMQALRCYESQFDGSEGDGSSGVLDDVTTRARYWGWTIGTRYAEPFACREPVGLAGLRALV